MYGGFCLDCAWIAWCLVSTHLLRRLVLESRSIYPSLSAMPPPGPQRLLDLPSSIQCQMQKKPPKTMEFLSPYSIIVRRTVGIQIFIS